MRIQVGTQSKYYKGELGDIVKENPLHQEAVNSMPAGEIKQWIDSRYSIGYCSPYKMDCFGVPIGFIAPGVGDSILDPNDPFAIAYYNGSPQFRKNFVRVLGSSLEERITKLEQRREEEKPDDKDAIHIFYGFEFAREMKLESFGKFVMTIQAAPSKFDFKYKRPHPHYIDGEERTLLVDATHLLLILQNNTS